MSIAGIAFYPEASSSSLGRYSHQDEFDHPGCGDEVVVATDTLAHNGIHVYDADGREKMVPRLLLAGRILHRQRFEYGRDTFWVANR